MTFTFTQEMASGPKGIFRPNFPVNLGGDCLLKAFQGKNKEQMQESILDIYIARTNFSGWAGDCGL